MFNTENINNRYGFNFFFSFFWVVVIKDANDNSGILDRKFASYSFSNADININPIFFNPITKPIMKSQDESDSIKITGTLFVSASWGVDDQGVSLGPIKKKFENIGIYGDLQPYERGGLIRWNILNVYMLSLKI